MIAPRPALFSSVTFGQHNQIFSGIRPHSFDQCLDQLHTTAGDFFRDTDRRKHLESAGVT
jgi:hypothetical protein